LNLKIHGGRQNRARFLRRLALLSAALAEGIGRTAEPSVNPGSLPARQTKPGSKVKRWDVITIGNLSRNRYWGESDAKGLRAAICTCTVISGDGFRLLVDPSLSRAEDMAKELERRTGLKPGDIDSVFITHEHADHYAGLAHFPRARWLGSPEVARILNGSAKLPQQLEPVTGKLFDQIEIVPTPGHTMSLCSLRFDWNGLSVAVVGDAVATRDFWLERRGYFNCVDFALSARSMDKLAQMADIIVPGHDNYFLAR
jgi:glyoxylase-like metal-dependent hydrolase (beta-lactamase superfamily II)